VSVLSAKPIVFLFGAGASYAANDHVAPKRPPLGHELYDELASFAAETWGPSSFLGRYAESFRNGFEATLNRVLNRVPTLDVLLWFRDLACYFAQFHLRGNGYDPYSELIGRLREGDALGKCLFTSLNYECLFELAAVHVGLPVIYDPNQGDAVLKIHGSCNFVTDDLTAYRYLLTNPNAQVGCELTALPPGPGLFEALRFRFAGTSNYFPVVSLYAWGKNTPVGGSQIQAARNRFRAAVLGASAVVLIGVAPNQEDIHLWEPISRTAADVSWDPI
jgi:hypothetical protein